MNSTRRHTGARLRSGPGAASGLAMEVPGLIALARRLNAAVQ
jgi:hypothetical protein